MLNNFSIGHYTNEAKGTGVTAIICEKGAVGGVSVRGSSPATRETDLLKSEKTVNSINAVVLSGGSAFGLEAACGVMRCLHDKGVGYSAGKYKVPIVVGASLYDLEYRDFGYPSADDGYAAAKSAVTGNFGCGNIGVASGATVSKALGMDYAVKTGLGICTHVFGGIEIAVIVGVNALGDIVDGGKIIAGAKNESGEFVDTAKLLSLGNINVNNANTTIGCIITNAKLTKVQANILADLSHDGFARALSPSHTMFDGDAMFVMASGEKECSFLALSSLIPELTARAIQASVSGEIHTARKVGGIMNRLMKKFIG